MDNEKPSDMSPEDKTRLDAMGHDRVMADLAKKYQRVKPTETESSAYVSPLEHLKQRSDALIRELEQLPKHRETYKKQELEAVLAVEKRLQWFIDKFDQATKHLAKDSSKYQELCEQYIKQVIQYMDQESFWAYKFTTENTGGASSDQPLEHSAADSVYYMTQSGISLRIKRSASNLGLATVIQPFHEKIVFGLPNSDLKEDNPQIAGRVTEYRSDEFREILKGDNVSGDLESSNEIYTKHGKIFFVASNDRKPHIGDRVNQILETR